MMFGYNFHAVFGRFPALLLLIMVLLLWSCGAKKEAVTDDQETCDETTLQEDEDVEADTLVYEIEDAPLTDAVDESFVDFLYTFYNRRGFLQQRSAYPVHVLNAAGEEEELLTSGKAVSKAVHLPEVDFYMFLMDGHSDPYDYLDRQTAHAALHVMRLSDTTQRTYAFDKQNGEWMLTAVKVSENAENQDFWRFYQHFASDSLYMQQHLSPEIFITMPSPDDEMQMIDGNIDPDQWDVFGPELPYDTILLLDMGTTHSEVSTLKLVKCGMASSMMEVLTFEKEGNEWKLIKYEE